jgi:hypothetical protein
MSATKDLRLALFVKKSLDVILALLIGACVFLVLWIAISPLILAGGEMPGSASVPVAIGSGLDPKFEVRFGGSVEKGTSAAYVEEAQGVLRLETTNWGLVFISNMAKLLTAIGIAYVIYLLRSVLQAIIQENPFGPETGVRIRRIGYLVLLVGLLRPTVEYIAANEILNQLPIAEPMLNPPSPFKAEIILASLLILILAQVWSYGLEIERDRALTI